MKLDVSTDFFSILIHQDQDKLEQIYQHPFNQLLFEGSLGPAVFGYYLANDCYYLHHLSVLLENLAQKISKQDPALSKSLIILSKDAIKIELDMQEGYSQYWLNQDQIQDFKPSPIISSYLIYLRSIIEETDYSASQLALQLMVIMPCFWIYSELGLRQPKAASFSENPYKNWILTYSNPRFIQATQELRKSINHLAKQSSLEIQKEMQQTWSKGLQFELEFFNEVFEFCNKT